MSRDVDLPNPGPREREDNSECATWQSLLEAIPYARHLGLVAQQGPAGVWVHLPYRESLVGNFMLPALHGGVIGAMIEITAQVAARCKDAEAPNPRILDSNINYLRSAQGRSTFASAELVRQGRRTSLVQVNCWQSDWRAPIASGRVQLLFSTTSTSSP